MAHDSIAVIDFGGQYAHLIAAKVRRRAVLAEIRQPEDPIDAFLGYRGIIISGSPSLASQGEDSAAPTRFGATASSCLPRAAWIPRRRRRSSDNRWGPDHLHLLHVDNRLMTATPVELPTEVLDDLREEILDLPGVSSLALDIASKPPGTIEWE